jgi:leucyl/phenylalanyl-tRNA---protein transferase
MLTPELMLRAYADGIFPMAESRDAETLHWVDPRKRGIFPLPAFHISRSLRGRIVAGGFTIRVDTAFSEVVSACANRDETWINAPLCHLYDALHAMGHAHSLEVWDEGALVGGVFGLTLGAAFFGESMFSRRTDGSKIALTYLVDRLNCAGFQLFDTQFITPHLASLGAVEIPRAEYRRRLAAALKRDADFSGPETPAAQLLLQRNSQMS